MAQKKKSCEWCLNDPLYLQYHDQDWGVPVHDDRLLFEMLILEGAQAGLNWLTVLKKRQTYRKAFLGFNPVKVAKFNARKKASLLKDPGIIRNRLKVESAVKNAKAYLKIQDDFGSFDAYLWAFVNFKPIQNKFRTLKDIPAKTAVSDALSKDLKKRGFNFVGSTICYAYMQAVGLVNDHVVSCYRYKEVKRL